MKKTRAFVWNDVVLLGTFIPFRIVLHGCALISVGCWSEAVVWAGQARCPSTLPLIEIVAGVQWAPADRRVLWRNDKGWADTIFYIYSLSLLFTLAATSTTFSSFTCTNCRPTFIAGLASSDSYAFCGCLFVFSPPF